MMTDVEATLAEDAEDNGRPLKEAQGATGNCGASQILSVSKESGDDFDDFDEEDFDDDFDDDFEEEVDDDFDDDDDGFDEDGHFTKTDEPKEDQTDEK